MNRIIGNEEVMGSRPCLDPEPPDIRLRGLESNDILEAVEAWRVTPILLVRPEMGFQLKVN